jgi:hypothetical protein
MKKKKFPINTTGNVKSGTLDKIMDPGDLDNKRSESLIFELSPSDERWLKSLNLNGLNKLSTKQNESFDNIVLDDNDLDWARAQRKKKSTKPTKRTKKCKCK